MSVKGHRLAEVADAPFEVKSILGTNAWLELWNHVAADPQAHIDALVEAEVLKFWDAALLPDGTSNTGQRLVHACYTVVRPEPPHVHEWYVAGIAHVHGTERSASLRCECGATRSATNRLPIEIPK